MTSKHPFAPVEHKGGKDFIPPMCFPSIPEKKLPTKRQRIIMKEFPPCPKCLSTNVWSMGSAKGKVLSCNKCYHRWTPDKSEQPGLYGTFYGPWEGKEIIKLEDYMDLLDSPGNDWSFYKGKRTWTAWNARNPTGDICLGLNLLKLIDSIKVRETERVAYLEAT